MKTKLIVWGKSNCSFCQATLQFLEKEDIDHEYLQIPPFMVQIYADKGVKALPVVVDYWTGEVITSGFNTGKIKAWLKAHSSV